MATTSAPPKLDPHDVLGHEGTSEIHTLILGEALTGERALT